MFDAIALSPVFSFDDSTQLPKKCVDYDTFYSGSHLSTPNAQHIHQATTASARPPRQTRTHILEGRLPGRCHVAQLHPAHERTHAISSVPLRSLTISGPVSLQSGFGRVFAAFLGQWASRWPGFSLLSAWRTISDRTFRLCSKFLNPSCHSYEAEEDAH